jgi:hypothetical protein
MDGVGHVPMIHAPEAISKALLQTLEPA